MTCAETCALSLHRADGGLAPMSGPDLRRAAAARALDLVEPGMRLGLGTGSTAAAFVGAAGRAGPRRARHPRRADLGGDAASRPRAGGIRVATLDETAGARPDRRRRRRGRRPKLRLIKGGGAALLLREKIVACASRRMVVIAEAAKRVATARRLPAADRGQPLRPGRHPPGRRGRRSRPAGCTGRGSGCAASATTALPLVTDGGHHILDAHLGAIPDPEALGAALWAVPGVVEHGLFLGIADAAILAGLRDGRAEITILGSLA